LRGALRLYRGLRHREQTAAGFRLSGTRFFSGDKTLRLVPLNLRELRFIKSDRHLFAAWPA